MAHTSNTSLNIEQVAFGDTTQLADWLNEIAWVLPLVVLNVEPVDVIRIHAERLVKLRTQAYENFDSCATALFERSKTLRPELELLRQGMHAYDEASTIADPHAVRDGQEDRNLRDALWEALELEALGLEPVRKSLGKEVGMFLAELESLPNQRIEDGQAMFEEGLTERPMERARLIKEARKNFREAMSLDGVKLDHIFAAEIGWINWQASAGEAETLAWFSNVLVSYAGEKGYGIACCARLYAYMLARVEKYSDAYRWARIAADLWPSTGCFHERARYAILGTTADVAKREVVAFIKKGPFATLLAFADPTICQLGPDLVEICIQRQQNSREKAMMAVGEWELAASSVSEAMSQLPSLSVANDLLTGAASAKSGLDQTNFLVASQVQLQATDSKTSLNHVLRSGIQLERKRRTEALAYAKKTVDAIMQERDDMLKSSTAAHDVEVTSAKAALLETEDNSKAQKGCAMGMGGGCAILVLYMFAAFMLGRKGMAMGPGSPIGMMCIAGSLVPLAMSVIFYVGCMSRRMLQESKLNAQINAARQAYEVARNDSNSKFRGQLESAKARAAQEEQMLQHCEAIAKQFGC